MPVHDDKSQIISLFADLIEVKTPDFGQILATPVKDLEDGQKQLNDLCGGVVRIDPKSVDPQAVGRSRYPNLHGAAALLSDGLGKNPDIAVEVLFGPEILDFAVELDQAFGRFIFASQRLWHGGETGEVVAGAMAQQICTNIVDRSVVIIKDVNQPADLRSDLAMAMEEPMRLLSDERQRLRQAQGASTKATQASRDQITQVQDNIGLTQALDGFFSSARKGQIA